MGRELRRIVVLALGWTLLLLGVAGLFLPVLQGILFILLGLYVLSRESSTAHRLFERLRARYPKVDEQVQRIGERFRRRWRRQSGGGPGVGDDEQDEEQSSCGCRDTEVR